MRLARTGLKVCTRLIARDTVAVDTLASRAISRSVSPSLIVIDTVSDDAWLRIIHLFVVSRLNELKPRSRPCEEWSALFEVRTRTWLKPGPQVETGRCAGRIAVSRHCRATCRT